LIIYRKSPQLRIKRLMAPEPPWWAATIVAPYTPRRGAPVAIDYVELRASYSDRLEVAVSENVTEELERAAARGALAGPVLVDAAEFAEVIFRRGEEALEYCHAHGAPAIHLITSRGVVPAGASEDKTLVVAAWPLDFDRLESLCKAAGQAGLRWGLAVPVIFPVTTDLPALAQIADFGKRCGAAFLTSLPLEIDSTAKHAIAQSLTLEGDEETYGMLFHADLDPVHVATERHIAALAAERGLSDFIVPPRWEEKSNWNAAVIMTMTASRMIAMQHEVEQAGALARAARLVAALDKPIERVAAAANLSIIDALDGLSVDILTEWLERGRSTFVESVNAAWRLRRDAGVDG
jgi:hypothetical protein